MTPAAREALRAAIAASGFDVVRFAAIAPPQDAPDFRAWLAAGHHADMDWLPRTADKRADPQRVLPGARTMILLGVNYLPAGDGARQERWAKYALWSDYHDTIARGLHAAGAQLEQRCALTREDYRVYVDAGPVLERGWAAQAGMGWRGKNAMLLSREHGNWLFLAAIVTRAEIPADEPLGGGATHPTALASDPPLSRGELRSQAARSASSAILEEGRPRASVAEGAVRAIPSSLLEEGGTHASEVGGVIAPVRSEGVPTPVGLHCGTCTRCLDACPTDAFPQPGWVDARRCISYHTIENRGIIPRELRGKFGGRVFGCDVCLDVCPWNRFAQRARSALLVDRQQIAELSLLDLLTMEIEKFREVFRRSPIKRVKLPGLLRNACIAAGNWHETDAWHFGGGEDRETVARAVESLCTHESPVVRAHAVWALDRLVGRDTAQVRLAAARAAEQDEVVLDEYRAAEGRA